MAMRTTIRIPDEIYDKIKNSSYPTVSECIIQALIKFFNESPIEQANSNIIYSEDLENSLSILQNSLEDYKKQIIIKDEQLKNKDDQLKIKDQQIFSLIAVQKDLTEKTTEQVKLLADQMKSKKWYQFWK